MSNITCGFDIGSTNIKSVAVDTATNEICLATSVATSGMDKLRLFHHIQNFTQQFLKVQAVGVAYSGVGNAKKIDYTGLSFLKGIHFQEFERELHVPTVFINDASAVAYAGSLKILNSRTLVALTNGTGIGMGIVNNGMLMGGAQGYAGEIHASPISTSDGIKQIGSIAGGRGLLSKFSAEELTSSSPSEDVTNAIQESALYFGLIMSQVTYNFNPDVIYLSGGTLQFPNYLAYAFESFLKNTKKYMRSNLKVVVEQDLVHTGAYGAALYAVNQF